MQNMIILFLLVMSLPAFGYYCPNIGRWTTRDPIEEKGGANLYAFCKNDPIGNVDTNGCAYFAYRPLKLTRFFGVVGNNNDDLNNTYLAHENLFFSKTGRRLVIWDISMMAFILTVQKLHTGERMSLG